MPDTDNNKKKLNYLYELIKTTFARTLRRGFFGRISFHASVQDGEIQEIEKQETEKHRVK